MNVNQKSNWSSVHQQITKKTLGGSRGAHPRGDSGGLMHEEEFEDASMNADEEEAGVGTIKRRSLAYLEYKNSRNGGRPGLNTFICGLWRVLGEATQFHLEKVADLEN